MGDRSRIEWTEATWNPITGCTLVSEGCRNCYAARLAATRLRNHPSRKGLARLNAAGEAKFTGEVRFNEQWLDQPVRWRRPRMIFVCAHGDLFHPAVSDAWIDSIVRVMLRAPRHVYQVLTKRPERMRRYFAAFRSDGDGFVTRGGRRAMGKPVPGEPIFRDDDWPPRNIWLGTSCEDQATADERIPHLLATPAAVRFVSLEPLLGPIDLTNIEGDWSALDDGADDGVAPAPTLDWVIVGGESGPGARPFNTDWALSIVQQCRAAGVSCFLKQLGAHVIQGGERRIKRDKKGADMSEWPHDLCVREMPDASR